MNEENVLHDITSYEAFYPRSSFFMDWWFVIVLGMGLGVAGGIFWFRTRKAKRTGSGERSLLAEGMDALRALEERSKNQALSAVATEISQILRGFLTAQHRAEALYQSREQFAKAPPLLSLGSAQRQRVEQFLSELWNYQYSLSSSDPILAKQLLAEARRVLKQISQEEESIASAPALPTTV